MSGPMPVIMPLQDDVAEEESTARTVDSAITDTSARTHAGQRLPPPGPAISLNMREDALVNMDFRRYAFSVTGIFALLKNEAGRLSRFRKVGPRSDWSRPRCSAKSLHKTVYWQPAAGSVTTEF